jgi:hypothetical protein
MGETARGTQGHNAYGSPPINDILIVVSHWFKTAI